MAMLLCPVCGEALRREDKSLRCGAGHGFDIARQGYVNLLTVDHKHSLHPGDTRDQVAARRAFLDAGYYAPIAEKVAALLAAENPCTVLDAGCGEGYYLSAVRRALPAAELWGVDISKDAVRYAAVREKTARFFVGTAAHLPFADGSFDCVISMFALTAAEEFRRVLRPNGLFLQVIAAPEHLMALKTIIYPEIIRKEKTEHAALDGFILARWENLDFDFTVEGNGQFENLLSMTPHFWRISRAGAEKAAATDRLSDTARIILNLYRAN